MKTINDIIQLLRSYEPYKTDEQLVEFLGELVNDHYLKKASEKEKVDALRESLEATHIELYDTISTPKEHILLDTSEDSKDMLGVLTIHKKENQGFEKEIMAQMFGKTEIDAKLNNGEILYPWDPGDTHTDQELKSYSLASPETCLTEIEDTICSATNIPKSRLFIIDECGS